MLPLATIYWILKIIGAALIAAAAWLKLRFNDKRAARSSPTGPPLMGATADGERQFATRPAPAFSPEETEPVAYLSHVIDSIETGDIFLFMGVAIHSYMNRIAGWTRFSHVMMAKRVDGRVYAAEVVERFRLYFQGWRPRLDLGGFRLVPIEEYVAKYPGQVYFARVSKEYEGKFNRGDAGRAILASSDCGYGWFGIGYNLLTQLPFVRILAYLFTWRDIDKTEGKFTHWGTRPPFCSWAVSLWATFAGVDPVPCLAPQLTTPAEIERSLLWGRKVALVP